jgi:heat shock protein HtpX
LIGGRQGLLLGFVFAVFLNILTYFYSGEYILRLYGAQRIEGVDSFDLNKLAAELAKKAEIPAPKVFVLPCETPNALSIGRSPLSASILITDGLLRILNQDELKAVFAHELMHIKRAETFIGMITTVMASGIMFVAQGLGWLAHPFRKRNKSTPQRSGADLIIVSLIAPVAALIVKLVTRKNREFEADQSAAEMTRQPQALATALWKIHHYSLSIPMPATEGTAHNFIVNPLGAGLGSGLMRRLFNTHPPVEARIKKLIGRTL